VKIREANFRFEDDPFFDIIYIEKTKGAAPECERDLPLILTLWKTQKKENR
jgi:hypothetical protein